MEACAHPKNIFKKMVGKIDKRKREAEFEADIDIKTGNESSQNESEENLDDILLDQDLELSNQESQSESENEVKMFEGSIETTARFQNSDRTSRMRDPSEQNDPKKPSFTSAIQRLLEKPTTKKPILSKNTIEKRIDEKKLEAAAKKVIKLVKVKVSNREMPVVSDYDRQMRKIATRGGKKKNYDY